MTDRRRQYLQAVLLAFGVIFLFAYALTVVWPSGWVWTPRQHEYEQMIFGVYAVLGLFLILASRRPEAYGSLIWFTVWSSAVHGGIMAVHALSDPDERGHLLGDVRAAAGGGRARGARSPRPRTGSGVVVVALVVPRGYPAA